LEEPQTSREKKKKRIVCCTGGKKEGPLKGDRGKINCLSGHQKKKP